MKRLIQPMLAELYADHWLDEFLLEGESLDIAWQIHKELQVFEPCGDDDNRTIWLEVPRGCISDWMSYEEAVCYEDVHDEEDYVEAWKVSHPRETEWLKVMTSVYDGNIFLRLFDGESCFGSYRSKDIGSCSKEKPSEYLALLLNEIRLLKERIISDPESYNEYVEKNLPKQKRTGRISRKELNRILPWYKEEIENQEEVEKILQDCIECSGEPLERMTIRIYCKYYRIAYEAYAERHDFEAKDDVEFYTKCAHKSIDDKLSLDSEKDFKKFAYDHYGELGLTRMNLYACDYDVPGKWVFHFAVSYSAWLWDALKIAKALYESGAPLQISSAERTLAALQERDYVRLTPHTFHNYLNHHEENSVLSLHYECECVDKAEPECFTREQLQEIIDHSEWLPEDKLKVQHKIPLDSSLYDLIRDEVKEPMFLYDIKMYLWEKHDKYVSTWYCDEFDGNGYTYGHSDDEKVYDSWSEAIQAAIVECIQKKVRIMKIFEYNEAKQVVVCGDIHGAFETMVFKACVQYGMTDTLIIVAGDCGFGFERFGYYGMVYIKVLNRLLEANNWIVFVRGNHDDPSYFLEEKICYERFRCVPDYSVIQACGLDILCVGGGVSIDRLARQREAARYIKKEAATYWADEKPVFDEDKIKEISNYCMIDTVVTHTAPSFCPLLDKNGLRDWAAYDPQLLVDCDMERTTMDRIYQTLKESGHPVDKWYYGHFHQKWIWKYENTDFKMLDIMEFATVRTTNFEEDD